MANLKHRLARIVNLDFMTLTAKNIDERQRSLSVAFSVSALLRWAINNDLKTSDMKMESKYSLDKIFIILTMVIYPRSFRGFNLNPRKADGNFQATDVEILLRRLKYPSYLNRSGFDILKESGDLEGELDFHQG